MTTVKEFIEEVERRGGETSITGNYGTVGLQLLSRKRLGPERRTLYLLGCEGWRKYGCTPARWARLAYLCGHDDNGLWAVRVPGTLRSAKAALEWITPRQVREARKRRLRVLRQGDVYAVERPRDYAEETAGNLDGHTWHHNARVLTHDDEERHHAPLRVPFPCALYQQRGYEMGRSGRTAAAD